MNNEKIRPEIQIIKEAFQEKRNIIDYAPEEMIQVSEYCHNGGDIFITEEGELIDLEYQMKDFDEEELVKYIELAEELYEKNNVVISIYILCPKTIKVTAPEIPIKSTAIFISSSDNIGSLDIGILINSFTSVTPFLNLHLFCDIFVKSVFISTN